ncbi:MAG: hypothetical protein HDS16_04925 [Bacteroides sp.]|nr:hypothetical protein [Bacteroides sp.]
MNRIENTIRFFEDVAREQDRAKIEKQRRERLGIPEVQVYEIRKFRFSPILRDQEPRIKVSPYAKFDKYHKKKKRK